MVLKRLRRKPAAACGAVSEAPAAPAALTRPDVGSIVGDAVESSTAPVGGATASAVQETGSLTAEVGGVTVRSKTQAGILDGDLREYRELPDVHVSDAGFYSEHGPKDVVFELWFAKRFPFWENYKEARKP